MKRGFALLLSTAVVSAALTGCSSNTSTSSNSASIKPSSNFKSTGMPIVKKPITLNFFAVQSPADGPYQNMLVFNKYKTMSNININWQVAPKAGAKEKLSLVLASNNLPDAFYKAGISPLDIVKYGTNGTLIPLEGLISKYAPNISALFKKYPDVKKALTAPDGHIYAISSFINLPAARDEKIWLNKNMLKAVNMPVPTTTDQLYQTLKAFKQKFPNSIPLTVPAPLPGAAGLGRLTNDLGGAFGLEQQMGYDINVNNGKVHVWLADKNYEELLQYLHKLYQAGLLDPAVFTQTSAQYIAKMQTGNVGLSFNQASDPFMKVAKDYMGVAPFKGPNGDQTYSMNPIPRDMGAFAITSKDKYPAATMRWLDYFYSEKGSIFFRYGVEGQTFKYNKNGLPQYFPKYLKDASAIGKMTPYPGGGSPQWVNSTNSSAIDTPQDQAAQDKLTPYLPKTVYATPLFDANTATQLSDLTNTINTFATEESAKFVTGQLSFNQWSQYVSQLNKMGLDKVQQIYQDAFNKTYKN